MKEQYINIIKEFDKTLLLLRKRWIRCKANKKHTWIKRIDEALDERLRLMKLRDQGI